MDQQKSIAQIEGEIRHHLSNVLLSAVRLGDFLLLARDTGRLPPVIERMGGNELLARARMEIAGEFEERIRAGLSVQDAIDACIGSEAFNERLMPIFTSELESHHGA